MPSSPRTAGSPIGSLILGLLLGLPLALMLPAGAYAACRQAGAELAGTLAVGKHSHPNGSEFEIFILTLASADCFEFADKSKSNPVAEVQLDPADAERLLYRQLDGSRITLQAQGLIAEETAWHVRPVVATDLKLHAVTVGPPCRTTASAVAGDAPMPLAFRVSHAGHLPFYAGPSKACVGQLFLVNGDAVRLLQTEKEFARIEYTSKAGTRFSGWVEKRSLRAGAGPSAQPK